MFQKNQICLLIMVTVASVSFAQGNRFVTLNNLKARPLAMGGAFTAIEDDLSAINFNPAAFTLYGTPKSRRITLFLNPVSPIVGAVKSKDLFSGNGSNFDDYLLALSLFLKSVSFTFSRLELSILLGEQGLYSQTVFPSEKVVEVSGFRQNHSHSFVASLKLAEKVSFGGTASVLFQSKQGDPLDRETGWGISYGILLKPEKKLNIGVSFFSFADSLRRFREPIEGIVDESVNVGVSYQPFDGTLLSADFRNLGEEDSVAVRELHLGFEQVFFSHLAIRGGFFRQDDDRVFSFGIGLLDENKFFDSERTFKHRNFMLNYTFVYQETSAMDFRWHFFSLLFRL